jgi:hypothetical protein
MIRKLAPTVASIIALMLTSTAHGAENTEQKLKRLEAEMQELREQISATADKVEAAPASSSSKHTGGLSNGRTHISGYGELHYNNLESDDGSKTKDEIDFHRFVLEFGHEFNETTRFFSEVELEHSIAGDGKKGEIELEQAYIQHDFNNNLSGSAGVMLIPVGLINETHEPPAFYGVERNPVEKNIIPATWWAGGVALSGKANNGFSYDLMVHEGLKIKDDGQFKIRGGRQKTAKASAKDFAVTGRVKYTGISGVELGLTAQHQSDYMQGATNGGSANLVETHVAVNKGPLSVKALYANWSLDGDAAAASNKDKQDGAYIETGYKITPKVGVFARHSVWDNGGIGDTKMKQTDVGVSYWLNKHAVFKADIQSQSAGDGLPQSKAFDGFNLGVGYQF